MSAQGSLASSHQVCLSERGKNWPSHATKTGVYFGKVFKSRTPSPCKIANPKSSEQSTSSSATHPPSADNDTETLSAEMMQLKIDDEKRKREAKAEKRKVWHEAGLNLEAPTGPNPSPKKEVVFANCFAVKLLDLKVGIYSIELGKIGNHQLTERTLKRNMISSMLMCLPPKPSQDQYVTDYNSYIVSAAKPYDEDEVDIVHFENANQSHASGATPITSTVRFQGYLNKDKLLEFVQQFSIDQRPYDDTLDIQALNIISWAKIFSNSWEGDRVGRKFYAASSEELKIRDTYVLKRGFFSSMRPGTGGVLLNVNLVTSAFFPDGMVLHDWIYKRWRSVTPPKHWLELKGVKVRFEGDGKTRSICGFGRLISKQDFVKRGETKPIRVKQHMENRKCLFPSYKRSC